jgi:plasmid stabilization system protein ParE
VVSIRYSAAVKLDLEQIGDYLAENLKSPQAALNTVNKIQDSIDRLADFPFVGTPLSVVFEVETDFRFLVCGNYLVFYRVHADSVNVDRVIYGKRDYLAILFSEFVQEDDDYYL